MEEHAVTRSEPLDVLRDVDDLGDAVRGGGEPLVGVMRVGVIPTVAPYLLPGALETLRTLEPEQL